MNPGVILQLCEIRFHQIPGCSGFFSIPKKPLDGRAPNISKAHRERCNISSNHVWEWLLPSCSKCISSDWTFFRIFSHFVFHLFIPEPRHFRKEPDGSKPPVTWTQTSKQLHMSSSFMGKTGKTRPLFLWSQPWWTLESLNHSSLEHGGCPCEKRHLGNRFFGLKEKKVALLSPSTVNQLGNVETPRWN